MDTKAQLKLSNDLTKTLEAIAFAENSIGILNKKKAEILRDLALAAKGKVKAAYPEPTANVIPNNPEGVLEKINAIHGEVGNIMVGERIDRLSGGEVVPGVAENGTGVRKGSVQLGSNPTTQLDASMVKDGEIVDDDPLGITHDAPETTETVEPVDNTTKPKRKARTAPMRPESTATDADREEWRKQDEFMVGVDPISDAQLRKIFATLGGLGIKDNDTQKQIIYGLIADQHDGYIIKSTTELSKAWAIGLIDVLEKSRADDLLLKYETPF